MSYSSCPDVSEQRIGVYYPPYLVSSDEMPKDILRSIDALIDDLFLSLRRDRRHRNSLGELIDHQSRELLSNTISVASTLSTHSISSAKTINWKPQGGIFVPDPLKPITQRTIKRVDVSRSNPSIPCLEELETKRHRKSSKGRMCRYALQDINVHWDETCILDKNSSKKYKVVPQGLFDIPINLNVDPKLTKEFAALSDSLKNGVNITHSVEGGFSEAILKLTSQIANGGIPVNVKTDFGDFSSEIAKLTYFASLVVAALNHSHQRDSVSLSLLLALIAYGLLTQNLFTVPGFDAVAMYVTQYLSKANDMTPQMNTDIFDNIISSITMLLIGVATGDSKKSWSGEVVHQIFNYKKTVDSVSSALKAVVSIVELVVNYVKRDILGGDTFVFLESNREDINEFLRKVTKLSDDLHHSRFAYTQDNATFIHELWLEAQSIIGKMPKSTDPGLMVRLNNVSNFLVSQKKIFDGMNLTLNGSRVEPTSVLFVGPPGTGKSNLLYPLTYEYLSRRLPAEKLEQFKKAPNSFIYNRQAETVYWDGYNMDKWVCFIDDLGQMRDVAGNPDNEWMNWIRMCSSFNYVLHMAALEKKGNVYFQSRLVVANTNLKTFNVESIVEIEAFKRRVDKAYLCVPKVEFCKKGTSDGNFWGRRLDGTKLPLGPLGITELTPDTCEFHEIDVMTDTMTGSILTYEQVLQTIIDIGDMKEKRYNQTQIYLNKILDKNASPQMRPQMGFSKEIDIYMKTMNHDGEIVDDDYAEATAYLDELCEFEDSADRMLLLLGKYREFTGQETCMVEVVKFFLRYEKAFYRTASLPSQLFVNSILSIQEPEAKMMFEFEQKIAEAARENRPWWDKFVSKMVIQHDHLGILVSYCDSLFKSIYSVLSSSSSFIVKVFDTWKQSMLLAKDLLIVQFTSIGLIIFGPSIAKKFISWFKSFIGFFSGLYNKAFAPSKKNKKNATAKEAEARDDKLRADKTVPLEPEFYSGKPQRERTATRKVNKSSKELRARLYPVMSKQSASRFDQANEQIMQKIHERNSYELWIPDQKVRAGVVTFIRGRNFIMPKHFAHCIDDILENHPLYADDRVTLKKCGSKITYEIPLKDMLNIVSSTHLDTYDIVIVQAPNYIPVHCDITKHFLTEKEINDLPRLFDYRLYIPSIVCSMNWLGSATVEHNAIVVDEVPYTVAKTFSYRAATREGDCGGLFTICDRRSGASKICGIHIAGVTLNAIGMSAVISREDILSNLPEKGDIIMHFEDDDLQVVPQGMVLENFTPLYMAKVGPSSACKTAIIKSQLHNVWSKSKQAPAALRSFNDENGNLIIPYTNAISGYCDEFIYIDPLIIKDVGDNVFANLEHVSKIPVERKLLSYEEAIVGMKDDEDFAAISRSTSLGYPDVVRPGPKSKGKTEAFGTDGDYTLDSDMAKKIIADCIEIELDAMNNIRNEFIYVDCLKDERRPIEKVKTGKTRLFSVCPVRLLILYRRYFGAFILWCHKNRINNGFAVGVNPYSEEWELVAQKLNRFAQASYANKGAGDYSGFDKKHKTVVQNDVLDHINKWYSDEHSNVREVLWLEITNSKHIFGNTVYSWDSSGPSGHPLTTLLNNLVNHYCANYVWYKTNSFQATELVKFYDKVYYITLGDDNLFAVDPDSLHLFNEKMMEEHVSDLGMKYTSETKTAVSDFMRPLTEVSFLKRNFRFEPIYGRYCAPLELDVILEMPQWTKEGRNRMEIQQTNVETALRELSLHPKEVFNTWAPKIINASRDIINYVPPITERHMLLKVTASLEQWY